MGLFDGMMGNASEVEPAEAQKEFAKLLTSGENIERAYVLIRDMLLFTNKRLVLVDKQGLSGKKVEYHSVPYSKISHFSIETAGTLDMDAELKIWIAGSPMPLQKTFNRKLDIMEVQRVLAERL